MLRIYPVMLEIVALLQPVIIQIARRDPDLARQIRRAQSSGPLNVAEGMYSRGANRLARYHDALGSMCETRACVEVAQAAGYVGRVEVGLERRFDYVIGSLVRLVDGPRVHVRRVARVRVRPRALSPAHGSRGWTSELTNL